jgi:osmoprotectant transport system ATP-binding protein
MGYVIQNTGLFPNMTVRRNVATVPRLLGWDRPRIDARVAEMLALVGLDPADYADKLPSQLSGGEAQRVGVARALAADPPVMLMDEPFGAVDPITRTRLQLELKSLHARLRTTIVFVTHDIDEAVLLADRIVLLRDGVLQQYASAEEMWRRPANDFVRDFLGTDLGLRVMQRHTLESVELAPVDAAEALPTIESTATLRDALALLVDLRAERLSVTRSGAAIGEVTFERLVRALRSKSS